MSKAQVDKVIEEITETSGKVDTLIAAIKAIRERLGGVENQDDPKLAEAIALSDAIQAKADEVMANTDEEPKDGGEPKDDEEPKDDFEPSQN